MRPGCALSSEEPKDFDGPQVLVPEDAIRWLRDKLRDPISRSSARRQSVNKVLFELVREGIVNALVHRDYSITGAKCQLVVTPDTITIKSPGKPIEPITVKQIQDFSAPMLSRNPALHYVFAQMELAEERGLGLKSMKTRSEKAGLPLPRYSWEDPYLVLTVYRSSTAAVRALDSKILAKLNKAEREGLEWLATREKTTTSEYQKAMGVPNRTAKRHLKKLSEVGLLRVKGAGRATCYEVTRS